MQWVMVGELGQRHPDTAITTLDAALTLAIQEEPARPVPVPRLGS